MKQRGWWAPFAPFSFRVRSLALDDSGTDTGPALDLCDVHAVTFTEPVMPPQVQKAWAAFLEVARESADADADTGNGGGVLYSIWKQRSAERGIPGTTFRRERDWLLHHRYITQPEARGPYWRVDRRRLSSADTTDGAET